jgi:radical SAM protein with 4Fe4S-binding SPASM domain
VQFARPSTGLDLGHMHLEFTLTAACALGCRYCPQGAYARAYRAKPGPRSTTLENYERMLANVADTTKNIDFSGYTEPLHNPYWLDLFRYTLDHGYAVTLFSTLAGASHNDLNSLSELAISRIYVHLLDHAAQRDKLEFFIERCQEHNRDFAFIYFNEDGRKLAAAFQDQVNCEQWTAHSRAGLLEINRQYVPGLIRCCEQREFCSVVLPNGDVHICCMDFALQHRIGNLLESPLSEIHHSDAARAFRATMASTRDGICNHCIYAVPAGGILRGPEVLRILGT